MKKFNITLLMIIFIQGCLLFCTKAYAAACEKSSSELIVTINGPIELSVKSHSKPGTSLSTVKFNTGTFQYSCDSGVVPKSKIQYTRTNYIAAGGDIYQTEIPGIGVRIKWGTTAVPGTISQQASCTSGCSINSASGTIEFIQTGRVSNREMVIPAGVLVEGIISNNTDTTTVPFLKISLAADVTIKLSSCTIKHIPETVPLGDLTTADFSANAKIPKAPFTVVVECLDNEESIGLIYTPVYTPGFGQTGAGLIGIENETGSAQNFAVKIFSKEGFTSSALKFNEEIVYPDKANTFLLHYEAQVVYFGDTKNITGGTIKAGLMYTLIIY